MADALILGCGYTGLRLGRRLAREGHRVAGTTRSEERAGRLEEAGVRPLVLDVSVPEDVARLADETPDVCFYLIPPLDPDPLADVLRALGGGASGPEPVFVYASSTGVYGDRGGAWVDETDEPSPDSAAGEARLAAERTVLSVGPGAGVRPRIARISGIYGPGRTLRAAISAGRYHVVEGADGWTNRIHVEDLVSGLVAAWREGEDGRAYNLADGHPHRSAEFARLVGRLCGIDVPVISREEAERRYSPRRLARKLASKRVSNRRMREELGVEPAYPSFREGVPAALAEEGVAGEPDDDRPL